MRLSAIMELPVMYIFTHDSIGVGEDGPTHQPVEQLSAVRTIPGMIAIRPADANEVAEDYKAILPLQKNPAALILTRQKLPTLDRSKYASAAGLHQGAYVLAEAEGLKPDVILIASGSEVSLCVEAHEMLRAEGIQSRVVSMPSWELFDAQPADYRNAVLPPDVTARVAVEAGVEIGWSKYLGPKGRFLGMGGFGMSSPVTVVLEHFGFTPANVAAEAKAAVRDAS
jgi:transketolase